MIKLVMSDMDGTLLDEKGKLPSGFDDMVSQLRARGILFAPCSGRQYFPCWIVLTSIGMSFCFWRRMVRW